MFKSKTTKAAFTAALLSPSSWNLRDRYVRNIGLRLYAFSHDDDRISNLEQIEDAGWYSVINVCDASSPFIDYNWGMPTPPLNERILFNWVNNTLAAEENQSTVFYDHGRIGDFITDDIDVGSGPEDWFVGDFAKIYWEFDGISRYGPRRQQSHEGGFRALSIFDFGISEDIEDARMWSALVFPPHEETMRFELCFRGVDGLPRDLLTFEERRYWLAWLPIPTIASQERLDRAAVSSPSRTVSRLQIGNT